MATDHSIGNDLMGNDSMGGDSMGNGLDRRDFLRRAGAAAIATAVASGGISMLGPSAGGIVRAGKKAKSLRPVTLGFIALTDCASLVMAKELGFFEDRGLDVTLAKQASWPSTRDALLTGQIDGAHALYSLPFSVASGIGGKVGDTSLKIAMVLNVNGQAITMSNEFEGVGYADLKGARKALEKKTPTMAMTFPGGTHDTWLRYWLKAAKVDRKAVNIIPIPPPQMVANMKVGTMDGFCVGEPWNAVAVQQGVGFPHLATQDLWTDHPEKALVVNERFASEKADVLEDVVAAVLDAGKWLDAKKHRVKAAAVLGRPEYVNAPAADIAGRLAGVYDLGADLGTKKFNDDAMQFFKGGSVNAPRRAHAIWFMTQYQRFGLIDEAPPYSRYAEAILLRDLYEKVAKAEGIDVPDDDMKPFTVKLDAAVFDPKQPEQEVDRP
jgi:nitrate/nitrite transport system substrate-binding protein